MADHCSFCDTRRPMGGTNILILNGGEFWAEFCPRCGDSEWLTNGETGEEITVGNLFRLNAGEPMVTPTTPPPSVEFYPHKSYEDAEDARLRAYLAPPPPLTLGDAFPELMG